MTLKRWHIPTVARDLVDVEEDLIEASLNFAGKALSEASAAALLNLKLADQALAAAITDESATVQTRKAAFDARRSAQAALDDVDSDETLLAARTAFLTGEMTGFRLGLEVFASIMRTPEQWGIPADVPPATLLVALLTDDMQCSEAIAKALGQHKS